jgi:hypothetical protein
VAESSIVWVEKTTALEGVSVNVTGAGGGAEVELQPAEKRIRTIDTTVPGEFRFIIYPKREVEAGRQYPYKVRIRAERRTGENGVLNEKLKSSRDELGPPSRYTHCLGFSPLFCLFSRT